MENKTKKILIVCLTVILITAITLFFVTKNKDRLVLVLDNGEKKIMTDIVVENDSGSSVQYRLHSFVPEINTYIVDVMGDECVGGLFINKTNGNEVEIPGGRVIEIKFNSDKTIFGIISEAGCDTSIFTAYRINSENKTYTKIFEVHGVQMPNNQEVFAPLESFEFLDNTSVKLKGNATENNSQIVVEKVYGLDK